MPDDLKKRTPADRARVNVHEKHELRYWREKFGCTDDELKAAVQAAGVLADRVEARLKQLKAAPALPAE
jgi:hypothetical protein